MVDVPSATDLPSAFATSGLKVEPSSSRFATGYLASEQLPAEHFNYLLNRISTLGIDSNTELMSVIGELKTMLTAAGYSPDSGSVGQLKLALDKLYTSAVSNVSVNYIANATIELGITGYATYNDGAVSVPIDGTGGTPTISISHNATTPIFGNYDLQIDKPASNCQGQGISKDLTIDRGAVGQHLYIEFSYNTDSGFVNNDIGVYIYDKTNANVIYPSIINLSSSSTTSYIAEFIPSTSLSYRLIWHIKSTNAVAWTAHIDNVSISVKSSPTVKATYTVNSTPGASATIKALTKIEDNYNAYSTTTGQFTVPVAGRYRMKIILQATSTWQYCTMRKNAAIIAAPDYHGSVSGYCTVGDFEVDCVVGDLLDFYMRSDGSNQNCITANNASYVQITRIGS